MRTSLIALERGDRSAHGLADELVQAGQALRVPAAVWVEYLAPMAPGVRRRARSTLEGSIVFEPFDRDAADEAVDLQHELLGEGRRLGWHDAQVAATARLKREPLVSNDVAMQDLPGVETRGH